MGHPASSQAQSQESMMAKSPKIIARELTPTELDQLIRDKALALLAPEQCCLCGCIDGFRRRVFRVLGVTPESLKGGKVASMIRSHFLRKFDISHVVFFPTSGERLYFDSATCPKCEANSVSYHISFDDEVTARLAATGETPHELMHRINHFGSYDPHAVGRAR
jgi:hypothetical protein